MPTAKVTGDFIDGFKGISIRDSEGRELRVDLTQTQRPPDTLGSSSDSEFDGVPVDVQGSQSSSGARRVAVRKVPASRFSQESKGSDDHFVEAPPLKRQKAAAGKNTTPTGRADIRRSPRRATTNQSIDDEDDFVDPPTLKKQKAAAGGRADLRRSPRRATTNHSSATIDDDENKNKYPTIRCAPYQIATILESMSDNMKGRLTELGFEHFLGFRVDAIEDRGLALFLMEHVQLDPLRIEVGGRVLPVTSEVVKCVLGIPSGPNGLPQCSATQRNASQLEFRRLCDSKGMKRMYQQRKKIYPRCKDYDQLKPNEVHRWVVEEFAREGSGDDWSITCFFMALFDGLLFPTTSLSLSGETYFHCKRVSDVGQYDLCSAVIEDLTTKVRKWKKSSEKRSLTTTSMQGCVILFLLYYLDNLCCPQHMLQDGSTTPRAAHLNTVIIELAKADKKRLIDGSYTYGNLPFRSKAGTCYENVRGDDPPTPGAPTVPTAAPKSKRPPSKPPAIPAETKRVRPGTKHAPAASTSNLAPTHAAEAHASATPNSAAATPNPAATAAERLHLMPCFADLIPQLFNEELQHAVTKAFQDYDRRMDSGILKIEEGKAQIHEAHNKIVHEIRTIIGGVPDASNATTPRPSNASDQETAAHLGTPNKLGDQPAEWLGNGTDHASAAHASSTPVEETEAHKGPCNEPMDQVEPCMVRGTATDDASGIARSVDAGVPDGSTAHVEVAHTPMAQSPTVENQSSWSLPPVFDATPLPQTKNQSSWSLPPVFDATPLPQTKNQSSLPPAFDATPLEEIRQSIHKAPALDTLNVHPPTDKPSNSECIGTQASHDSAGVADNDFNREHWNHVASILRDINETSTGAREDEVRTPEPLAQGNAIQCRQGFETGATLRRSTRLNKGEAQRGPDLMDLGVNLIMKHTTSSRFLSPFDAHMFRRQLPDVDKAMKVRAIMESGIGSPQLQQTRFLICVKKEFRCSQLDHCSAVRTDICESFSDAKHCECLFIDYFAQCLRRDDIDKRPTSAGYRVILPAMLSEIVLFEQYKTGKKYSPTVALSFFRNRFNKKDILHAKLILFPVHHERHWTVYCVNLLHEQIDILDSFEWPTEKLLKDYHGAIAPRIRTRLHDLLKRFTHDKFKDFSTWGFAFVPVPKQALPNDSGIFAMMFLEYYDGEKRKMDIDIDPLLGSQIRAQFMYYMLFHAINERRPLPPEIEQLAPPPELQPVD